MLILSEQKQIKCLFPPFFFDFLPNFGNFFVTHLDRATPNF